MKKLKENLIAIWHDELIKKSIILTLVIFFLFTIILALKLKDLPPQLPLFYSLPRGNDQLGNPILLLILPLSSFLIEIINTLISAYLYKKEILLARMFAIIGSFISVVLFISFIKIISIVS